MSGKRHIGFGLSLGLAAILVSCSASGSPSANAGAASSAAGEPVRVTLTEFQIEMPGTVPAGRVTFEVTNSGSVEHNFEIEGQGVEEELDANLAPGETQELTVELASGSYEIYCPVDGHRDEGMETELEVS